LASRAEARAALANRKSTKPKAGDLRVWWIPQVPGEAFHVPVSSKEEGKLITTVLAFYDLFQLSHNIKPDYTNAGGIQVYEGGEWVDIDEDEDEV
jgi:hypothetical protein